MREIDVEKITRFEVIDENGRVYVRDNVSQFVQKKGNGVKIELSVQDDGRTLKVFVKNRPQSIAD